MGATKAAASQSKCLGISNGIACEEKGDIT